MNISAKTKICLVIGDQVEHSLSPAIHNAAYEALGIDDQFVFAAARVKVENVGKVIEAMRVMNLRGLSCTLPHKLEVMKYLDEIDPVAREIGAVNTVINDNGVLKGYNTDWLGAIKPLEKVTSLVGKKVALLGAGGAARAIAYGVMAKGAKLKIFNRTVEKAQELARELAHDSNDITAGSLKKIAEVKNYDIIINSTSVWMRPHQNESLVPAELFSAGQIVQEAVYVPRKTKLLQDAEVRGARVISGLEVLLYQGVEQFKLYTGREAPVEVMRRVLE